MQTKTLQTKRALRTALLVLLLGVAGMTEGYAYDFSAVCETGQTLYYSITSANSVKLTCPSEGLGWGEFEKPTGDIVLPERVLYGGNYYIVTEIDERAFIDCQELTGELVVPNTISKIKGSAFTRCIGLTGLYIPQSVTTIGSSSYDYYYNYYIPAFNGCFGIEHVTVDENNSVYDSRSNCNAIIETGTNKLLQGFNCSTIPQGVNEIGNNAFIGCTGLTGSLVLPNTVTKISDNAFAGCTGLTGSLVLPNTVTVIGDYAFYGCTGLTGSLVLPNNVTEIGDGAFDGCTGLTGSLVIPDSVIEIGESAFHDCSGMTGSLQLPSYITEIKHNTFTNCGFTGSLNIPDHVTVIDSWAFKGCTGFTGSLHLSSSLERIGDYAFWECGFTGELVLPYFIATIGSYAFEDCMGFTGNLIIPDAITNLGEGAFYGCEGFTGNLIIPDGIATIGDWTFAYCKGLTGLSIPQSVNSIGEYAFLVCNKLEQITVDENNPTYDSRNNCNALIETSTNTLLQGSSNTFVPNSVTTIAYGAFGLNEGLTGSFVIPNSVTEISSDAFYGCSGITKMTIGKSVAVIGERCFQDCTGLTNVTCLALTPAELNADVFNNVPCTTLHVPCQCIPIYEASDWHEHFTTIVQDCTGVSEDEENQVSIYPNPIIGQMRIDAEGLGRIIISNALGQVIHEGKANGDVFEYDFGKHEAGVYLVRIETAKGVTTKKITVTK